MAPMHVTSRVCGLKPLHTSTRWSRVRPAKAANPAPVRFTAEASMHSVTELLHWLPNIITVTAAGKESTSVRSTKCSSRTQLARLLNKPKCYIPAILGSEGQQRWTALPVNSTMIYLPNHAEMARPSSRSSVNSGNSG